MKDSPPLNQEQKEAIVYGDGPLLIIAGAGTGKTTVIAQRITHLILDKKVPSENILALTFTEKAAAEMEERIDIALPYGYTHMWIETFHAFCDRILRSEAINIGLNPGYKLATETESIIFLRKNLFALQLDYYRPLGNPNKFLQGLLQHFSRLKDEDINPQQYLLYANDLQNQPITDNTELEERKRILELAHAYATYEQLKIEEGLMDFSDLISNTLKLFRMRKHILLEYQKKFQYILIDEFQDTNFAQNELAILIAGDKKNLTVVGDDDQAIYRWRGAAISNMIQFKKHFPQTKIITLTKNYRSTSHILDSAYKLIQYNNPDRLEVKEHIDKHLTSIRKATGQPVNLIWTDRAEDEADMITQTITKLIKKSRYTYKDFAILIRANDHGQPFIKSFERKHIPYQFLGPGQLFQQEEIKDLIAYLKVLVNFEDTIALYRVLNMPIFHIPAIDIALLLNTAKKQNEPLFTVMQQDIPMHQISQQAVKKIITMIQKHLILLQKESAGKILYAFLQETGILQTFLENTSLEDETRSQNIAKFFDILKDFESQHTSASVFSVIEWIDLAMQLGESPLATTTDWSENDAVTILTIHGSKGLEFPVVFVTNLVTQRFPSRDRKEQIPVPTDIIKEVLPQGDYHMQEERRLFYVAMTRAKDILFLTAAKFYGEGKRERKLSPFVIETLTQDSITKIKQAEKKDSKQLTFLENFSQIPSTKQTHTDKPVVHPLTYLSYSQIQAFDLCPLHYKLRYLLKIPTVQTAAQSFGTSVHLALKDFYQRALRKESLNEYILADIVRQNWLRQGYTGKKHEEQSLQAAIRMIKTYTEKNYSPTHLPIALETEFNIYIDNQLTKNVPLKIGGKIDRIDKIDEKRIEIIDYKTGIKIPTEKDVANNLQLTLYALAASEIDNPLFKRKPEDIRLSLVYLEKDLKLTTTRTAQQLAECKEALLQKAQEIQTSNFLCSGSQFCLTCEYKMLCKTTPS